MSDVLQTVFSPKCNFELAKVSRPQSDKRKTEDRCAERLKKGKYQVIIDGSDPEMDEAEEYAEARRLAMRAKPRRRGLLFSGLPTCPQAAADLTEGQVREAFSHADMTLATRCEVLHPWQLGIHLSLQELKADTGAHPTNGLLATKLRQKYGGSMEYAYNRNLAHCSAMPGSSKNAMVRGFWRLYDDQGQGKLAIVTYRTSSGAAVAAQQVDIPPQNRMAWHTFQSYDRETIRGGFCFTVPAVHVVTLSSSGGNP